MRSDLSEKSGLKNLISGAVSALMAASCVYAVPTVNAADNDTATPPAQQGFGFEYGGDGSFNWSVGDDGDFDWTSFNMGGENEGFSFGAFGGDDGGQSPWGGFGGDNGEQITWGGFNGDNGGQQPVDNTPDTQPQTGGNASQNANTIKIMPAGDSITFGMGDTGGYRKFLDNFLKEKGYDNIDFVGPEGKNSASFNYNGKSVTYDDNHYYNNHDNYHNYNYNYNYRNKST